MIVKAHFIFKIGSFTRDYWGNLVGATTNLSAFEAAMSDAESLRDCAHCLPNCEQTVYKIQVQSILLKREPDKWEFRIKGTKPW